MAQWLTGWSYRKACTIRGSSAGAVADYQIKIVVRYGSGSDSGQNVYLNGKCRSDFGDVRFTDSDGTTLLSYWIEKLVLSGYAVFWVKVPYIPTYPSTKTIYIYYGNPYATSMSNGSATWDFFDDFDDLSGWIVGYGTWSASDSVAHQTNVYTTNPWQDGLRAKNPPTIINRKVGCKMRVPTPSRYHYVAYSGKWQNYDNFLHSELRVEDNYVRGHARINATWKTIREWAFALNTDTWYTLITKYYGSSIKIIDPAGVEHSFSDSDWDQTWIGLNLHTWNSKGDFDWIFVGKYVEPEPVITAWGSEETPAVAYTKTLTDLLGLLDRSSKRASKFVFDRVGLFDFYSRVWSVKRLFIDRIILTDFYSRVWGLLRGYRESIGLSDYYSRMWSLFRGYSEIIGLTDYVSKFFSKSLFDYVGLLDCYSRVWSAFVSYFESVGLADYVLKVSDYLVKRSSKALLDSLGLLDYYFRTWNLLREYSESVSLLDFIANAPLLYKLEALSLMDYLSRDAVKTLVDLLFIVDYYSRVWSVLRSYSESVGLEDFVVKRLAIFKFDTLGMSDYVSRIPSKLLLDALDLVDYYARVLSYSRSYLEYLGLSDYLAKGSSKALVDSVGLADYYSRMWSSYRIYSEKVGVSDYIAKEPSKSLYDVLGLTDCYSRMWSLLREYYEPLSLSDYISKLMSKSLVDSVGLLDYYSRLWNVLREYYESLGLSDYVSKGSLKALREMILLWDAIAYVQNPLELWKLIRKLTWLVDIGVCDL